MENKHTNTEEKQKIKFTDKKVLIPVISVVMIIVIFFAFSISVMAGGDIRGGVKINDINVGKMSKEEATEAINTYVETQLIDNTLDIEYEGDVTQYKFADLITGYDIETAVESAYNVGRNKNFFVNLWG